MPIALARFSRSCAPSTSGGPHFARAFAAAAVAACVVAARLPPANVRAPSDATGCLRLRAAVAARTRTNAHTQGRGRCGTHAQCTYSGCPLKRARARAPSVLEFAKAPMPSKNSRRNCCAMCAYQYARAHAHTHRDSRHKHSSHTYTSNQWRRPV